MKEERFLVIHDPKTNTYLRDKDIQRGFIIYGDGIPPEYNKPINKGFEMTGSIFEARRFRDMKDLQSLEHIRVYYPTARYLHVTSVITESEPEPERN